MQEIEVRDKSGHVVNHPLKTMTLTPAGLTDYAGIAAQAVTTLTASQALPL
jgi:hypothetical protein